MAHCWVRFQQLARSKINDTILNTNLHWISIKIGEIDYQSWLGQFHQIVQLLCGQKA